MSIPASLQALLAFSFLGSAAPAAILRVAENAAGAGYGTSWADAFPKLQDALTAATDGDEIWLAAGTYFPDERSGMPDGNPSSVFDLKSGVPLYGGFAGNETARAQRDPAAHASILSGDIGQDDANADGNRTAETTADLVGTNARTVVRFKTSGAARLDGLTITAAWGRSRNGEGGLDIWQPGLTVANCHFIGNRAFSGGGAYAGQTTNFVRCSFSGNEATNTGGAMNLARGATIVANCDFSGNHAGQAGGAIVVSNASPILTNCLLSGNDTDGDGGAVYNQGSLQTINCLIVGNTARRGGAWFETGRSCVIVQCTLSGNAAGKGGAIYGDYRVDLRNSIIWENSATDAGQSVLGASFAGSYSPSVSHCLIAGSGGSAAWNPFAGFDRGGNLDTDPRFLGTALPPDSFSAFRPLLGSPVIEAGLVANLPADPADLDDDGDLVETVPRDLAGDPRFEGSAPDMGALESGSGPALAAAAPALKLPPNSGSHPAALDLSAIFDATAISFTMVGTTPGGIATGAVDSASGVVSVTPLPDATGVVTLIVSATNAAGRTSYLPVRIEIFPVAFFVRAGAAGSATGLSWGDAFPTLQDALTRGGSDHEIRVAEGVYYPDQGGGQTPGSVAAKFVVPPGVTLLGGFAGTETPSGEADPAAHPTVLSGDVGRDDADPDGNFIAETPADHVGTNASAFLNLAAAPAGAGIDGFILTAAGSGGALKISSGSPFVRHCRFSGNSGASGGAVVLNTPANVEFADCTFSGNTATAAGGAVFANGGTHSFSGCGFSGNAAHGIGGGGGAIFASTATASIRDCDFHQNQATATFGYGGAVKGKDSALSMTRCLFQENGAYDGGALHIVGTAAVSLTNCRVRENVARSDGGAIYLDGIAATITGCEFSANRAAASGGGLYHYDASPTFDLCSFAGNAAGNDGGAIYNRTWNSARPAAPILRNCIVWNNRKGYESNPAGTSVADVSTVHPTRFSHCLVAFSCGSTAWNPEMGIDLGENLDIDPQFLLSPEPGLTAPQNIDLRLQADSPAIDAGSSALVPADRADLNENGDTTETLPLDLAGLPRVAGATVDPGAFEAETGPAPVATIPRLRFDTLSGAHPGVLDVASLFEETAVAFSIENQNSVGVIAASISGVGLDLAVLPDAFGISRVVLGAMDAAGRASFRTVTVDVFPPVIFVAVDAAGKNNGLTWEDAFPTLQAALAVPRIEGIPLEIWVKQGVHRPDQGPGQTPGDSASTFRLPENCHVYGGFFGNETQRDARDPLARPTILSGDLAQDDLDPDGDSIAATTDAIMGVNAARIVTADDCVAGDLIDGFKITAADGGGLGGGLSCTGGTLEMANCLLQGNRAIWGGGARFKDATVDIADCRFIANRASDSPGFEPSGGGIDLGNSTATLSGCRFTANQAVDSNGIFGTGGAVNAYGGSLTVVGCDFEETVAGGAIRVNSTTLTASDSRIAGTLSGGGLLCSNSATTLTRCQISGNDGGGLHFGGNFPLTCTDTVISGNNRSGDGGGAAISGFAPIRFTNCLITGNRCWNLGGGIDSWARDSVFTDCTFSANRSNARGGAFYAESGSAQRFVNCIFWENQTADSTTSTFATLIGSPYETPPARFRNCIVANSGGSAAWNTLSGYDEGGNLDADPRFLIPLSPVTAPSATGDFQLVRLSPALEAGDNAETSAAADLAGAPRIVNGTVDMGAYEGQNDQFDSDSDGLSDAFEMAATSPPSRTALAPDGDEDGDGKCNLLEFAFGSDPTTADNAGPIAAIFEEGENRYLSIRYDRDRWASQFLTTAAERAAGLGATASWLPGQTVVEDVVPVGNGRDEVTERSLFPLGVQSAEFLRIRVTAP